MPFSSFRRDRTGSTPPASGRRRAGTRRRWLTAIKSSDDGFEIVWKIANTALRAPDHAPEITLAFWIIKIAATTLGETGGDSVDDDPQLGLPYRYRAWSCCCAVIGFGIEHKVQVIKNISPRLHSTASKLQSANESARVKNANEIMWIAARARARVRARFYRVQTHRLLSQAAPFLPHPLHRSRPLRSRTLAAGRSPPLSRASGAVAERHGGTRGNRT